MTAIPREVARKHPAQVAYQPPVDDGRTIDGQWRATRGGPTLRGVLTFFMFMVLGALFLAFTLAMLTPTA